MKRIFLCLLAFSLYSCGKTYISSIPNYPVYLELNLAYDAKDLLPMQSYKIYTPGNIDQAIEQTGFGGVLVYHGIGASGMDAWFAFDAACPHEANRSVTVEVDDDHIYAICPKCQTKYELMSGSGRPESGPGREQLKPYHVRVSNNIIYVSN
jgi:nitrite reductase/ring-hydroxylating ferredoxin subunit